MTASCSVSWWRTILLVMAGLGIMMQAAIPAGFMPDIAKRTGSFITICSAFGEKTVFVADEAGPHGADESQSCQYAFTLPALGHAPFAAPAHITALIAAIPFFFYAYRPDRLTIDPSSPPTGPPVIA